MRLPCARDPHRTMNRSPTLIALLLCLLHIGTDAHAATDWNVALWGKRRAFTENVEKLAELVDQKTGGEFQLKLSYGGISKSRENLDGISFGAFEMAQFCAFYHPDKTPSLTVTELPYSRALPLDRIAAIQKAVYRHPAVVRDLAQWNATLLMPTPMPQYNLVARSAPPTTLQNFDGLRIRGPGGMMGVLRQLGAVATGVPFAEVRQAMDSGVIDAAALAPHGHLATRSYKVGRWYTTNLDLGNGDCPVVVNTDALAALPPAYRQALLDSVDEALSFYLENYNNKIYARYGSEMDTVDIQAINFSAAQTAELDRLAETVREDWVRRYQSRFDARALYDFTAALYAEAR